MNTEQTTFLQNSFSSSLLSKENLSPQPQRHSMTRFFFLITLLSVVALNFSCKKSPTEPTDNTQPGRRDYVWTVDTLNYPYNTIYRIWGSSPTDVWAISPGGDLGLTIFHYDGNRWLTDGISRPISPSAVWGFANDNIFIGGSNGKIWKYNGNIWQEFAVLTKDGNAQIVFDGMWGDSPNNFFAFGAYCDGYGLPNNSVIVHYTDNEWGMLNTTDLKGIVEHLYKEKSNGHIFMQVINMGGAEYQDSTLIYEYSQGKYSQLYGSIWTRGYEADISLINNEVYFILGSRIAKRMKDKFVTIFVVDNPNFYQHIWGKSAKDIFLAMTDGLAHYNGSNVEYLKYFDKPRTQIFGSALFEKEVFFIVYEAQTNLNLIYHGVLK